ncbi:hypothetical protein KSP40_PGU006034 [Platanthera guangdongensis]|uniref:PWWP domain-containing protein n=1 Tax=Platanthera guangdongensis TaxID=2320717 RepID=A0ABR2M5W7_9ASPA
MSFEEDDSKKMDGSAGRLVWVRRRNGSWWPGRILSVDELTKCLGKKKTGTPIKLLGRQEATVDWFNLEKSKRIKPFRCGEYDACIARARAYAIRSNKRSLISRKYARREDAIIQALELEKYHLTDGNEMQYNKNNSKLRSVDKKVVKRRKMMVQELISIGRTPMKPEDISTNELSHSVVSFERPEQTLKSIIQFIQKRKRKKSCVVSFQRPMKPEDISTNELSHSVVSFERPEQTLKSIRQFIPKNKRKKSCETGDDTDKKLTRMKDLQDLGLGMTSTERSDMHISIKEACAQDPCVSQSELDFDKKIFSVVDPRSSFKHSCSSSRSIQMFRVYKNHKRRNRRRLRLTKIGLGSHKVNVPLTYQHSVITGEFPCKITLKQLNDLKCSSKEVKISLGDNGSVNCSESSCGRTPLDVQEKNGTAVYDFNPPSAVSGNYADDDHSGDLVCVPVLFGERNMEGFSHIHEPYTSGKIHPIAAEKLSIGSVQVCLGSKSSERLVEACSTNSAALANHTVHRTKKNNIELNSKVIGDPRYSSLYKNPNSESSDDAVNACDESLTADISDQSVRCGFLTKLSNRQEVQTTPASINRDMSLQSDKCLRSSYSASSAQLMQVQDSNKRGLSVFSASPQRVVLDQMYCSNLNSLYDVELKVQANYHGRRAPLVSVVSKLNGKAIVGHAITVDVLSDGSSAALLNGICHLTGNSINLLGNRVNVVCNRHEKLDGLENSRPSHREKTFRISYEGLKRKPLCGRKHRSSPRKIRRLSSITVDLNGRENGREIMLEKLVSSSVSCIPIRVVFSRLNEALRRSSYSAK